MFLVAYFRRIFGNILTMLQGTYLWRWFNRTARWGGSYLAQVPIVSLFFTQAPRPTGTPQTTVPLTTLPLQPPDPIDPKTDVFLELRQLIEAAQNQMTGAHLNSQSTLRRCRALLHAAQENQLDIRTLYFTRRDWHNTNLLLEALKLPDHALADMIYEASQAIHSLSEQDSADSDDGATPCRWDPIKDIDGSTFSLSDYFLRRWAPTPPKTLPQKKHGNWVNQRRDACVTWLTAHENSPTTPALNCMSLPHPDVELVGPEESQTLSDPDAVVPPHLYGFDRAGKFTSNSGDDNNINIYVWTTNALLQHGIPDLLHILKQYRQYFAPSQLDYIRDYTIMYRYSEPAEILAEHTFQDRTNFDIPSNATWLLMLALLLPQKLKELLQSLKSHEQEKQACIAIIRAFWDWRDRLIPDENIPTHQVESVEATINVQTGISDIKTFVQQHPEHRLEHLQSSLTLMAGMLADRHPVEKKATHTWSQTSQQDSVPVKKINGQRKENGVLTTQTTNGL